MASRVRLNTVVLSGGVVGGVLVASREVCTLKPYALFCKFWFGARGSPTDVLGLSIIHSEEYKQLRAVQCLGHKQVHVPRVMEDGRLQFRVSELLERRFSLKRHGPYDHILREFPTVTRPPALMDKVRHSVTHTIETKGQPVAAKPRRLTPDRYNIAREEFRRMMEDGICRPSKSAWASPLHIVTKPDGGIRPCGDYRQLNDRTLPDRYCVPNVSDLSINLYGKKVFSKLDLERAYFNIPIAESDIPKTAITTLFGLFEITRMCFGLFLRHITRQTKVEEITSYPRPETVNGLRKFLGMVNFYRRSLLHAPSHSRSYTTIYKAPRRTTALLSSGLKSQQPPSTNPSRHSRTPSCWDTPNQTQNCFSTPMPRTQEWVQFFSSMTKARGFPWASSPKHSTKPNENTPGRQFTIRTDHKPLTHVFRRKSNGTEPRRTRQLNYISQYTTKISHISGSDNVVADTLSRMEEITLSEDPDTLAQEQQVDSELPTLRVNPQLQLKSLTVPGTNCSLIFETSTLYTKITTHGHIPPYPRHQSSWNTGHTQTYESAMAQRYFWPSMNADVARWTRACIPCQRSKVGRHTVAPIGVFPPAGRFEHVHLDIIGPLPPSQGKTYCLTMIDRCTRWPEAVPIRETSAETIAKAFYERWISRFGVPLKITTDQGRQFESQLFTRLTTMLGIQRLRTSAYHPQANGVVERWHRSLKAALTARLDSANWVRHLPTILLGLRVVMREDNKASTVELVYGGTLQLLGDLFSNIQPA
ncbi:hypothetical protein AAG570_012476 [Ranatra chinensis]|uniref:RNA-directed DNA polymerase n=1 Tax=Ranatra chinensis TaxID=642074 RepID=A0ABD0YE95_9HEMI